MSKSQAGYVSISLIHGQHVTKILSGIFQYWIGSFHGDVGSMTRIHELVQPNSPLQKIRYINRQWK